MRETILNMNAANPKKKNLDTYYHIGLIKTDVWTKNAHSVDYKDSTCVNLNPTHYQLLDLHQIKCLLFYHAHSCYKTKQYQIVHQYLSNQLAQ